MPAQRILFVCLGNICRSPAAEGAFLQLLAERKLRDHFVVDSAGTAGYHRGELPDPRTRQVAREFGIELTHRARQFQYQDFSDFDWILAMDRSNLSDLLGQARTEVDRRKLRLFRAWDPLGRSPQEEVPDPYYGSLDDFRTVQEMCLRTAAALLDEWKPGSGV